MCRILFERIYINIRILVTSTLGAEEEEEQQCEGKWPSMVNAVIYVLSYTDLVTKLLFLIRKSESKMINC
jgi:hypothetical protein